MKKGALVLAALIVLLAAILLAKRFDMAGCHVKYELILPDGAVLNFAGPSFAPGTADSLMAHDGMGLPPVEHVVQDVYAMPGQLLLDTVVKPRVITITTTVHGITPKAMHAARAQLMDSMRWNRGPTNAEPSILRYTVDGVSRDLYVHYAGAVRRSVGRYGTVEIIGFRLLAVDPMWYSTETEEQVLDWQDSETIRYFVERMDGLWARTITQPAAVAHANPRVEVIAIHPSTGDVYLGGVFWNWNNIPEADYIVRWRAATDTWENVGNNGVGTSPVNSTVLALYFAPDNPDILYVGGNFTIGGGGVEDYIAQVDVRTDTWSDVGGVGVGTGMVRDIVMGHDGILYVGGQFAAWNGDGNADNITSWDGAAWNNLGAANSDVYSMVILQNGNLIAGGNFTTLNGGAVAANYVGEWDGTVWTALGVGTNGTVYAVALGPDGTLFLGGAFMTAGGGTVNRIASWNGASFSGLGGGLGAQCTDLSIGDDGTLYAAGAFTTAGSLTLTDRVARWNGFSWARLDIDMPGTNWVYALLADGDDLYVGLTDQGTALFAGDNAAINVGNVASYPVIEIKNAGILQSIRNETRDQELLFDMLIFDSEIVTIDLNPGVKTIQSNRRGNRLGDLLPDSDMTAFSLECDPRAQYGGVQGANLITVFITDADPRESGDNNNQLSDWADITGISQANTELGKLYVNIVDDGGGWFHVDLYMDAAKANLVAHTSSYNGPGPKPIAQDNNSGLGGTVTIDALVGVDVDIEVWFTIATIFWHSRWWDIDAAVTG